MSRRLVVRSAAEADIVNAALWYEAQVAGLGTDFLRAIDTAVTEITRMPERFPMVHPHCRRALLKRFPQCIFSVASADVISIIACMHARRDPRRWEERSGSDRQQANRAAQAVRYD